MNAKTVVLEVQSPEQEALLRQFHGFVMEMEQLALTAPNGQVLDQCEAAVVGKGRDIQRQVLQQAVQRRIETAEKKGRCCASVTAGKPGKTAAPPGGKS